MGTFREEGFSTDTAIRLTGAMVRSTATKKATPGTATFELWGSSAAEAVGNTREQGDCEFGGDVELGGARGVTAISGVFRSPSTLRAIWDLLRQEEGRRGRWPRRQVPKGCSGVVETLKAMLVDWGVTKTKNDARTGAVIMTVGQNSDGY